MADAAVDREQVVLLERRGDAAVVTLDRPRVLNALNTAVLTQLESVLRELQWDPTIAGVVITGAGDRAFAAGADIAEMANASAVEAQASSVRGQCLFGLIEQLGKPVVAAVNGYAFGGGCELALACTLRLASPAARFGQPEVKLGLIPGYGGTQRLARLVGGGMAAQMILTGEPIDAERALRIGLINEIVEPEGLLGRAEDLIAAIARNAPIAVRYALKALTSGAEGDLSVGLNLESALFGLCAQTDDKREGSAAFLEKRAPRFVGR